MSSSVAMMQHIEQAGVHSGDSGFSLPPYNLPLHIQDLIRQQVKDIANRVAGGWFDEYPNRGARRRRLSAGS